MNSLIRWSATAGALIGWILVLGCSSPEVTFRGEVVESPIAAPKLVGTNWDGQPFQLDDVQGKVAVIFFGYTFCPDICPFTLAKMKQIYSQLGDQADEVAMIFASIDPQRDSVEKLASYVPNFDQRFYGLRLDPDQIDEVDPAFDLTVQYGQPKDGPGTDTFYYVDHTGTYFILDRQSRLRLKFPPNAKVADLVPDLKALLAEEGPEVTASLEDRRTPPPETTPSASEQAGTGIEIREPRVHLMPETGAAYFTIINHGAEDDRLIEVETPLAVSVESHESRDEDGIMRMVPHPEGFAIPAGGTVALEPGGKHLMLLELTESENEAVEAAFTLHFERAGQVEVQVQVVGIDHMSASSSEHSAHPGHESH